MKDINLTPMIRRILNLFIVLACLLGGYNRIQAQCGLTAKIDAIPRANICLGETVDLLAKNNLTTPIPAICGLNPDRTCGTGSDSINAQIGTGTIINGFNSSAPELFGDFGEAQSRSQIIILASELQATGFVGGKITALTLDIGRLEAGKNFTIDNLSIKMSCTSMPNFSNSFASGLDEVFTTKSVTFTATGNYTFNFDNAFDWDGVNNIVLEFCGFTPNGTGAGTANWGTFTKDHVPGFASWRQVTGSTSNGNCVFPGTERNFNQRPNIKFNICRPKNVNLSYLWTPNNGTLSSTTVIRPTANPTVDTRYYVKISKVGDPSCFAVDSVDILVEDPSLFTPTSNSPICEGSTLQLNANTTGVTYFWSGPNGFSSSSANPTIPSATVAASGTYTFLVDKGFCKATKTLIVDVQPVPKVGTPIDSTVCRSTNNINLFGLLTGEDAGGTWIDNNASGILTGSTVNPSLLNNNILPATFNYTYRIINACGTFTSTVKLTVTATKSAGIDDDTTICETSNAINLFSILDGSPNTGGTWTDDNGSGQMTPQGFYTPTPAHGGSTFKFTYTVLGTSPCPNASSKVTVNVIDQPFAGQDNVASICVGGSINLFSQLLNNPKTGGVWTNIDNAGGTLNASSGAYTSTGAVAGTYRFRYIVAATAPCLADTAQILLTINGVPQISNVSSICSSDNTTFQVTFNITGGNSATYNVSPAGTISGTNPKLFTSASIPDATSVQFTVSDANNCGTSQTTVIKRCACPTQAGTMKTSPTLQICNNNSGTAIYNGGFGTDGNDTLMYVLHTLPGNTLGTIIKQQLSPTFNFTTGIVYGQTYYISAVAGNKLGNNLVDLNDACLSVSAGTPVVFGNIATPDFTFSDNPACPGVSLTLNGTVTGSPAFAWNGPNNFSSTLQNPVINNLPETAGGNYTFTVTSNGCSLAVTKTLNVVAKPVITLSGSTQICQGQSGTITINVTAPSPVLVTYGSNPGTPTQVLMNPGPNVIQINPASTTTYSLIFANYPNGCGYNLSGSLTVNVVPTPIATYSAVGETSFCYNESNTAKIAFQFAAGFTANLTYSLNGVIQPVVNGVAPGTQVSFPANQPGSTEFRVESLVLNGGTCAMQVNTPPIKFYNLIDPIVSTTIDKTSLCEKDSVHITFRVLASEKVKIDYTIGFASNSIITSKDTVIAIEMTASNVININSASYVLKPTCSRNISESYSITVNPIPVVTINVTGPACNNINTGVINVTSQSGSDLFSINNGPFSSTNSFTDLFSGFYDIVVLSANGCSVKNTVEVVATSNLKITKDIIGTSCGDSNGSVNLAVINGKPPYSLIFDGNSVSQGLISNLPSGTYPVIVIDGNNCILQDQVIITPSTPITFTVKIDGPVDCNAPEYSKVTITPTGGSGTYFYQTTSRPNQTDSIFLGLYPQTQSVTVTDDRGCESTQQIKLTSIQKFIISPNIRKPLLCFEGKDAEILINTTNASQPALYSLDNIVYQSNNLFTGVGPGNFNIYVRETTGCHREQMASFSVTRPEKISLAIKSTGAPLCFNSPDGFISLEATGGSLAAKDFTVNGIDYQTNSNFSGLVKGNYTLIARNANGCQSDTIFYYLDGPADILINHGFTFNGGQSLAELTITANGGVPNYLYSIDGTNFFSTNVFSNLSPGVYNTLVRDSRNCTASGSINISGVGIDEELTAGSFSLYPNPFDGVINISVDKTITNGQLTVLNALGQLIKTANFEQLGTNPIQLNLGTDISPGIYTLIIQSDQGQFTKKIIKK